MRRRKSSGAFSFLVNSGGCRVIVLNGMLALQEFKILGADQSKCGKGSNTTGQIRAQEGAGVANIMSLRRVVNSAGCAMAGVGGNQAHACTITLRY